MSDEHKPVSPIFRKSCAPLVYYGSKARLAKRICSFLPPHITYVEVFGGGAALLFSKTPSPIEVYNDINGDLVSFFRVLQDREKFTELMHRLTFTLYSREEYEEALRTIRSETDEIERARKFFILSRMAKSQRFANKRWGFVVRNASSFPPENVRKWVHTLLHLEDFHSRLVNVQIEHGDFEEIIERYDYSKACFFVDPPFISTVVDDPYFESGPYFASKTRPYSEYNLLPVEDGERLVNVLLRIKGKAVITTPEHEVYEPLKKRYKVASLQDEDEELGRLRIKVFYLQD